MSDSNILKEDFVIQRQDDLPIIGDATYIERESPMPVVVFCHGYKGFKDWGAWNLVAEEFAKAGFFFLKFNFSHNGGTVDNPIDFPDLEAFSKDNFSQQLKDLTQFLDFTLVNPSWKDAIDSQNIFLIGHSRGGGVAVLQAFEDKRVKKLITWAGISDIGSRFPRGKKLEEWKQNGVYYVENGRTKQQMPHLYQFYEDFLANQERFHIKTAVSQLSIPYLVIHGTSDETVGNHEAELLFDAAKQAKIKWIANANHVFGMSQPWSSEQLPAEMTTVVDKSISFLLG